MKTAEVLFQEQQELTQLAALEKRVKVLEQELAKLQKELDAKRRVGAYGF